MNTPRKKLLLYKVLAIILFFLILIGFLSKVLLDVDTNYDKKKLTGSLFSSPVSFRNRAFSHNLETFLVMR